VSVQLSCGTSSKLTTLSFDAMHLQVLELLVERKDLSEQQSEAMLNVCDHMSTSWMFASCFDLACLRVI